MAYTQARFPNDEAEFPTPPLWLVWNADIDYTSATWDPATRTRDFNGLRSLPKGQIRHQPTLEKAKRNVHTTSRATGKRGDNKFWSDWAIYRWEDEKYVLKFSGFQGEPTKNHPLWAKGVAKDGTIGAPRGVLDEELAEVLESIRSVAS